MRMARSPLSRTALLHPRPCLVLGQENGLSNGPHSSPFIGSRLFASDSYAWIPMEQNRCQLQSLTLALMSFFPLSLNSAATRETSGRSPASNGGTVVSPFFLLLSRSSLRRGRPVKHRQPTSSTAESSLNVTRAHRWVDAPTLSGFTVWLTGSASFSVVEGPSPSSSRTACLRPTHGAILQVEAPSARAHGGGGLGIYPLENGGACQWRLSFYPCASPLQRLELTHRRSNGA
jgi:hypothetical protein